MRRIGSAPLGVTYTVWVNFAVAFAMAFALVWSTAAHAQASGAGKAKGKSADDQYERQASPAGPAAGASCSFIDSTDGVLHSGDTVTFPGDFSVAPGASVILDDADGTQGTLIDGENATISGDGSNIEITVTGDPVNVSGGNGELSDEVCNSIVATTGVSAGSADSGRGGVVARVLPNTGGSMLIFYGGALAIAGTGLLLLSRRASRG